MLSDILNKSIANGEKQSIGIAGFTSYVFIDRFTERTVDIPKNVLEDGSIASDHAVVNPVRLTISGVVSDIYLKLSTLTNQISRSSSSVSNFTNLFDNGKTAFQLQKVNSIAATVSDQINKIDNAIESVDNIANMFGNKSASIQAQFSEAIRTLITSKQLISLETKFITLENMMVTSYTEREDNKSEEINFSITAEEVRIAKIEYSDISQYMKNPVSKNQVSSNVDKGVQAGKKDEKLTSLFQSSIKNGLPFTSDLFGNLLGG